jgi:dihydrofolate reductase
MPFYAIAAMSENRVIGNQGKIPWHLPEDFRWFKQKTMGGILIMGRKTFDSIGRPLPGRETIVLSQSAKSIPGVKIRTSLYEYLNEQKASPSAKTIWICGGGTVYKQAFNGKFCDYLYLTRLKHEVGGDTFFPPFEDSFQMDQIIHENPDFRVERWKSLESESLPLESWPLA